MFEIVYQKSFFAFLNQNENNVEKAFQDTFKKVENELTFPKAREMGTTVSIVYIKYTNGNKILYCANVGDSRCVLISNDSVNRISYDHKCEDKNERERIKKAGGYVQNGRLMGVINLSRSIGDLDFKDFGLSSFPNFFRAELSKNDNYIVMASDGVWDVINDIDAYRLSQECNSAESLANEIVAKAKELDSEDNISCIAIKL